MGIQSLRQTGVFLASDYLIQGQLLQLDKEHGTLFAVGTAKGLLFWPKRSLIAGFIHIYKFVDDSKSLELLRKTQVGVPLFLCRFQGRLLTGIGSVLRLYDLGKKRLYIFADDRVPRWLTASYHVDSDTMAGADKFGNVYFMRLPQDVSDEIEEDPTGRKLSGSRESLMELQTR
uniref:RSE1/DDB1/CPSF1 C-terminal domain-containing protein n=1 Tax=Salix viminalis TaxID=40686 RepID=A0A6N2LAX1_SALVM